MATAAFRSSGRRSSIGSPEDAGSSKCLRRSRSLSRFSGRFPPPSPEIDEYETPRGRFVNKVRGSGILETSLDDLADEFFHAMTKEFEGDAAPEAGRSRLMEDTESSRRRGRSVSRHHADKAASKGKGVSGDSRNSRTRRSVSVSRSRLSEMEVDKTGKYRSASKNKNSTSGRLQNPSLHKQEGRALGRSMSLKDFFQLQDCYSSHSSSLTDDEAQDARSSVCVSEKTIREVYTLGKTNNHAGNGCGFGSYENKSKDQHLVEELMELEKSEKRKQDLLAALAIEEKRSQELSKIVKELLLSPKQTIGLAKSPTSERSNDKLKISKCLDEEAERYFEDFLSNVEDTDLSSFEGERSDAGSTTKLGNAINKKEAEMHVDLVRDVSLPCETDGVIFPWLLWETSTSSSPSPCKSNTVIKQNPDSDSGSCSPNGNEGFCSISGESANISKLGAAGSHRNNSIIAERTCSSFDMDEYLQLQHKEDLLVEIWEQRHRIASGSLVLCGRTFI